LKSILEKKTQQSFDSAASDYDKTFTNSAVGVLQRKRVYYWLNKLRFFDYSKEVFEINCGTGYDADQFVKRGHTLVATDVSSEMIAYASKNRDSSINFYELGFNQLNEDENFKKSEILFSNFGGLNCLNKGELKKFFQNIESSQKKGSCFIGVIMAKNCLMEDIYHALKFQFKKLGRRNTDEALSVNVSEGHKVNTYYHSPGELRRILQENYKIELVKSVALFLPPSYLAPFFKKHKLGLRILNKLEQIFGHIDALASWSDHYIIVAKKK